MKRKATALLLSLVMLATVFVPGTLATSIDAQTVESEFQVDVTNPVETTKSVTNVDAKETEGSNETTIPTEIDSAEVTTTPAETDSAEETTTPVETDSTEVTTTTTEIDSNNKNSVAGLNVLVGLKMKSTPKIALYMKERQKLTL